LPEWLPAAIVAVAAAALVVVAFAFHPVGDYFTETDFYGEYAAGARAIQHGHLDWSRYGVIGPVYELTLAAVGSPTGDLFTAARLISIGSAVAILAVLAWAARRRCGVVAASWWVLLVAANASFFRYGYSACTDLLGAAFWTIAAAALLSSSSPRAWVVAGIAAALATLTRYNLAGIVPAGVVWLLAAPARPGRRWPGVATFASVFLVVVAPLGLAALVDGHPLGAGLLGNADYYLNEAPNVALESRYRSLDEAVPPEAATTSPARLVSRVLGGIPAHLAADAGTLLGWPVAALSLLGVAFLMAARRARVLLALLPFWGFTFLALAPVFYSDRYVLALVPVYVAPAALGLAKALGDGRLRAAAAAVAGLLVVGASVLGSFGLQRDVAASIPREALSAAETLRGVSRSGESVLARKPHVPTLAGLESVPFPDADSLGALAAFAHRSGARYLYYSWFELRLRPRFGFLLDTSATVPGLTPLHATTDKPSATYRIDEGFGATPPWWDDPSARRAIEARVNARMVPHRAEPLGAAPRRDVR
jgi:hypothetical protein